MKKLLVGVAGLVLLLSACGGGSTSGNKLVVGMECNYAPFNWSQPNQTDMTVPIGSGQYCDGYDVQTAKKIAQDLGKELVIQKIGWDGLILAVQSGEIDAIIAGMSPTEERKKEIAFTDTYFNGTFGIMVRKDSKFAQEKSISGFENARLSAQLGTLHVDLLDQVTKSRKQPPMKDFPTMTIALTAGEIDGFVTEESTGRTIEKTNKNLVYLSFDQANGFSTTIDLTGVSVGVAKDNSKLLEEINKSLSTFPKAEQAKLMEESMGRQQ
ncbi:MAG: transporter substrate-binding domain-containing protein [Culicoidibacterales bacterium]